MDLIRDPIERLTNVTVTLQYSNQHYSLASTQLADVFIQLVKIFLVHMSWFSIINVVDLDNELMGIIRCSQAEVSVAFSSFWPSKVGTWHCQEGAQGGPRNRCATSRQNHWVAESPENDCGGKLQSVGSLRRPQRLPLGPLRLPPKVPTRCLLKHHPGWLPSVYMPA